MSSPLDLSRKVPSGQPGRYESPLAAVWRRVPFLDGLFSGKSCSSSASPVSPRRVWRKAHILSFILSLGGVAGCTEPNLDNALLQKIQAKGTLVVLTRNSPSTFFEGRDGPMGFEHDLVVSFAQHLGVTPKFVVLPGEREILEALREGRGDLAAAGLSKTMDREREFRFGPVYQEVDQQVVCRHGGPRPTNLLRLADVRLMVVAGSSHEKRLEELKQLVPDLTWQSEEELSHEQILEKVWENREIDCTVVDSNIASINRRFFPELVLRFPVSASQNLAWVLPRQAERLQQQIESWFASARQTGMLDDLAERYYGHVSTQENDPMDSRTFITRIDERLPKYTNLFKVASERYDLPWRLLAAQAYQESNWDPKAVSPTGVRGIMMLTQNTAADLGVKNRLDPKEAILAGAWYLADLKQRLPAQIEEPDRTWIALAAYNVGLGHVMDARELAVQQGKDPNHWKDLRTVLPLLARDKYFKNLKYGYARGSEPVDYVQSIRHYYDILDKDPKGGRTQISKERESAATRQTG
ncbi:MAG: membrane-bound lytic murein transglycosylase MltF [Magnetococcales bacterium]|nr:membrane-bound lytic murein transglycosylase MltF [Magnetococcales bacterium]